jgi:transposase
MQIFLNEVSSRHQEERIVMILDGAGWHRAGELVVPDNMKLVSLPPYAPELNPVEHLWDELREKSFGNVVFDSLDALEDHLEISLREMETYTEKALSIIGWPGIIDSLLI